MQATNSQHLFLHSEQLLPIKDLSDANRTLLCKSASMTLIPANHRLSANEEHHWLTYLLEGRMAIMEGKSQKSVLTDNSRLAKNPIFANAANHQWAVATTPSTVMRFDREQIELLLIKQQQESTTLIEVSTTDADNKVFDAIYTAFQQKKLSVPSLPDVALKVRDAIKKADAGADEVARIIQVDPVLTGRIIKIANSPVSRGTEKVQNLKMAIMRLGFEATRSLAFTLAIKQLFRGNNKAIVTCMMQLFNHSSYIAALSYVLTRKTCPLNPERAQLGGLVHNLGAIPILYYADQYPELFTSTAQLNATVINLGPIVGEWLLTEWEFDRELCEIAQSCRDWYRNNDAEIDYVDIVIASLLHHNTHDKRVIDDQIPALENVAVGRKLMDLGVDLSDTDNFFDEAKDEITLVKGLID